GDAKVAQLRLAHARADVLQAFEDERQAFRSRPVPTADQLREVGVLFGSTVKASLLNERLQELASPAEVARAETELGAAHAATSGPAPTGRLYDLEWLAGGATVMEDDRIELRARLWTE